MNKIKNSPPLSENALLFTIDVVGLYTSIPHDAGLEALIRSALDGREDRSLSTDTLIELLDLVLKNNHFEHNNRVFKQLQGTAICTKFAPPYVISLKLGSHL